MTQNTLDAKGLAAAKAAYAETLVDDGLGDEAYVIRAYLSALREAPVPSEEPVAASGDNIGLQPVRLIEMVNYDKGYPEPAEPMWRVEVSGYCADFEAQLAANNFHHAISSLASPAVAPVAVSVKPLRWEQPDGDMATETSPWLGHGTDLCQYYIGFQGGSWWTPFDGEDGEEYPTIEAAKAAAQSEYEHRILSSIIPATKGGEDALRKVRGMLEVEYHDDGRIASVGHASDGLRKMVAFLDAALAQDTGATPPSDTEEKVL